MEVVQRELLDKDEALRQFKHHLQWAQSRMKAQENRKRVDRSCQVG